MPIRVQTPHGIVEFPDGMSEQDMASALSTLPAPAVSHEPAVKPRYSEMPAIGGGRGTGYSTPQSAANLTRITEQGPMLGGMIGAMAGGPLGAAAGGAGGTLLRDLNRASRGAANTPKTGLEAAENVGLNAAAQGALTKGGDIISKGLTGGAQRLYRGLLKPSKAVRQEFGDVVPELLAARRPITKGGAEAADAAVDASRQAADDMIASLNRPSEGIHVGRVTQEFQPVKEAVQARIDAGVVPPSELDRIAQRVAALEKSGAPTWGRFDPTRAQTLKRTAQEAATGAYQQMQRGGSKMLNTEDLLDAATARGFKGGIEDVVPGVGQQNAQTQRLLGQLRALQDATGRTGNHLPFGSVSDLAALSMGNLSPVLGAAGKAATMAGPGSRMAIGMTDAAKVPSAQILRAIALMQLLQQDQPQ